MADVCDFLEEHHPEGKDNHDIQIMRELIPGTTKQFILFLFFFATVFPAAFGALIYARGLTDDPDGLAMTLVVVSFVLGLSIILVNINFPRRHEKKFIRFSDATVRVLETMGVSMVGYGQVIGGRNVYLLIVLSLITFGLFIIVWLCISMRDFNRHIDEQWNFENNLLVALKMVGLEPVPSGQ